MSYVTRTTDPETGVQTTGNWRRDEALESRADTLYLGAITKRLAFLALVQEVMPRFKAIGDCELGVTVGCEDLSDLLSSLEMVAAQTVAKVKDVTSEDAQDQADDEEGGA